MMLGIQTLANFYNWGEPERAPHLREDGTVNQFTDNYNK